MEFQSFLRKPLFRWFIRWNRRELVLTLLLLLLMYAVWTFGNEHRDAATTIIVITPTYRRLERFADMTRLSQTLSHVSDLHWIVVEDANVVFSAVERILYRSGVKFAYFNVASETTMRSTQRGWLQRDAALDYVRTHYADFPRNAVVFFADDDNSYDVRLFNRFIRNVKTIGFWPVGLVGGALVESPRVNGSEIVGWDVIFSKRRKFATDMAGFAVNLNVLTQHPEVAFTFPNCTGQAPEDCFLTQFNLTLAECQPFGYDDVPKEILVWHTKTFSSGRHGKKRGFLVET